MELEEPEKDAVTALLDEEARENCEPEMRRIVLTHENMATRRKSTRAIHEKQATVEELRGMRRAREGGMAAEADTVGVRREAERFAEDAKMDPGNCLMEILALKENQEGIRIRRSPGRLCRAPSLGPETCFSADLVWAGQ
jgi:hypothetical protein